METDQKESKEGTLKLMVVEWVKTAASAVLRRLEMVDSAAVRTIIVCIAASRQPKRYVVSPAELQVLFEVAPVLESLAFRELHAFDTLVENVDVVVRAQGAYTLSDVGQLEEKVAVATAKVKNNIVSEVMAARNLYSALNAIDAIGRSCTEIGVPFDVQNESAKFRALSWFKECTPVVVEVGDNIVLRDFANAAVVAKRIIEIHRPAAERKSETSDSLSVSAPC